MKFLVSVIIGGFVACTSAAPAASNYIVHEKRTTGLNRWSRRDVKITRDAKIPLSIGLTQRNLENGYDFLMDVSHPESANFGQHWSMDKIKETFAPSESTIDAVKSWLFESGIESERVKMSKSASWIKVDLTVEEAESLLKTKYDIYTSSQTGEDRLACEDYSLPAHLREHVDFITPTVHFDALVKPSLKRSPKLKNKFTPVPQIKTNSELARDDVPTTFNLTNCYEAITPECLRALYKIPNGTLALSSYGIPEYSNYYVQSDLDLFYSSFASSIPNGTAPEMILTDLDSSDVISDFEGFDYNGEANLDIQYAISLVYPQQVTLFQTGDNEEGASFNSFLDAIDGSYCSYEGGDDAVYDPVYPDPYGDYQGKQPCGSVTPSAVYSTSYGYDESALPASYMERQCNEYMKLGLAGISVLYSSGDNGVGGNGGWCCAAPGCADGNYNYGEGTFNPGFPSTCPYITSVGATQMKPNERVNAAVPEMAANTIIYSGGGFSNVFPLPDYQSSAVTTFLTSHTPAYGAEQFNNTGVVRGFPDVAVNGVNYMIMIGGEATPVYGTSASSPVFGAIITLINNERIAAGKSTVGFLNPTLYANPGAFTDITRGHNNGCGKRGFNAVPGWDPLTGLGTPNYEKLLEVFLALP